MTGSNQNLILVPGLICDDEVWAHATANLSEVADCRTVPADEADTMQGLARAVLENAPETFAIAGFSMGGYVALEVLRQAPERVIRIALLDVRRERLDNRVNLHVALGGGFGPVSTDKVEQQPEPAP